ncbi:MAG: class I SAM-dependent methyltransferase [Minwuia sp.]|nr:class I SAM-dependent methyltransferase [Minwuia sp.]
MPNRVNSKGSVFSTSDWLNNHFSIKSHGRFRHISALPIRFGDNVLDLGCANGAWSRLMAERVGAAGHVDAVDHDAVLIDEARNSVRDSHLGNRLTFSVADISNEVSEFEPRYSIVSAFNVLSLVPDASLVLKAIRKLLLPRAGLLILKDSAISTDFYWPISSDIACEIRKRLELGETIDGYDPNFGLGCRNLLLENGFSIDEVMLHSYAFMHPFSMEEQKYISSNAKMIESISSADCISADLTEWISSNMGEGGFFFRNSESIYTTTEFTYICSII